MDDVPEIDHIREILTWIGFTDVNHRNYIRDDVFKKFRDILAITEKDITVINEAFS